MSDIYRKLRPLLVVALLVGSVGAAPMLLTGGVGAQIDAVAVDDSTVTPGTPLSGYVSTDKSGTVHIVLDDGDETYNSADDSVVDVTASESLQSWDDLATDGLSDGNYTVYVWDNSSSSVSDGTNLSKVQDVKTEITIDSTDPTSRITDVNQTTVKGTDKISVTYEVSDTGAGVENATLEFVDSGGTVVKTKSVSSTNAGSTTTVDGVSVPSTEDTYDLHLVVTDKAGNTETSSSTTVTVDTTPPDTGLTDPEPDANLTSQPEIAISVSENNDLSAVEVQIKRSTPNGDKYYDGSGWVSSKTWVSASKETETKYVYNAKANGITSNGTYTVISRATDEAGHTTKSTDSSSASSAPLPIDSAEPKVSYTVDTHTPMVTDVTVRNEAGYDAVEAGDTVEVTATVSDATSGVDSVTVDATAFGRSESESLSHDSGDTYSTTFDVSSFTVPDGSTTVNVTATDAFGQTTTRSDSIVVNTSVADVDSLTVHADFVGIVEDTNNSIRVTATGLTDANGNTVTVGSATIDIAGERYTAPVTDGEIDARIDPTKIDDGATTNEPVVVEIAGSDATADTGTVVLVHEAQGLEKGYQLAGTPMPAVEVRFTNVSDVTTYDPTGTADWVAANEERVGEGYYINADSDDARVGYVFEAKSDTKQDYTQVLEDGFNLVSPAVDLNAGSETKITEDLGYESKPSGVNYHVQDPDGETAKSPDGATVPRFTQAGSDPDVDDNPTVSAYDGYFVEVTDSRTKDVFHSIASGGYNATKGS